MNKSSISKESLKGIVALLVHVANIDENYTNFSNWRLTSKISSDNVPVTVSVPEDVKV